MSPFKTPEPFPATARNKGLMAALAGSVLISFDPVFIRLSGTGGYDTAFLFGLFTAISMSFFIQITDKRGLAGTLRASGWPAVASGLLMLGSASCFILSVKHSSVANTMIILSGRPVLTAVVSWLWLRERTTPSLWLAIVGVISGIVMVVYGSLQTGGLLGDLYAVGLVVCLAVNGTLWRKYQGISRMAIVGLGGFFMAVVMFFLATPSSYSTRTWLIMAAMGLLSAPFGRVLYSISSRYIPAAETAMISLSNAVLSPVWVFFLFAEKPPAATLLGGAVVLGTILIYMLLTRNRARRLAAS